jgi:hypothetical protein
MAQWGRSAVETIGKRREVAADGAPECKAGGVTLDWTTVTAVAGADLTLPDGVIVKIGEKYLRYGQVICEIGIAEVQTITFTGGPTAGNATITLPAAGNQPAQTAAPVAFNATAQQMQDALNALSRLGPNGTIVGRTGTGVAGDPYIYTATFKRDIADVPQLTSTHTFTGGTTPTTTHATTTPGNAAGGKYGPFDTAATDGRQTLERGRCYIVNSTWKDSDLHDENPQAIEGGLVFLDRLIATTGTASLAAGPTQTNLLTAFPRLRLVRD